MCDKNIDTIYDLYDFCARKFEKITRKIVFLINIQEPQTNSKFKINNANKIELFTKQEYTEILDSIAELDIEYEIYHDELQFIEHVVTGILNIDNILVFNFARNGLKEGKKSLIPSFCDLLNIPYTGSSSFVQSLCRNKYVYNKYLCQLGISVPKTYGLTPFKRWIGGDVPKDLNEVILKPIAESGSIGISKKTISYDDLIIDDVDFVHNQAMLVQEYISGQEIECPFFVVNGKTIALPAILLKMNQNEFLDMETSVNNDYRFECLDDKITSVLSPVVEKVASALNIVGYGRIDFRLDQNGNAFLFDIATMPFICKHSSFSFAMEQLHYKRSDIFKLILCITMMNYKLL